jgi:hypothetical protein
MRNQLKLTILWLVLATVCVPTFAQGTAFTYQGRLNDGASPANGSYDLTFALFDAASGGTQLGETLTNTATAVSNGFFTLILDFGNQFPGAARWLEISARTNGAAGFTTLAPRQPFTAAPYALFAGTAAGANAVAGSNIVGNISVVPTLVVQSAQGDVDIQSSQGNATLGASEGNVTVQANQGNVTVLANTGSLTMNALQSETLKCGSSALTLNPAQATLQTPGGYLTLAGESVNVNASGMVTLSGGGITLNAGPTLQINATQTIMSGTLIVNGPVTAQGMLLTSDRHAKEHFTPLDPQDILAKVAALPISEWNYKTDRRTVRHVGPMAQDFHAAFGLDGGDDRHISVVDEGGVALAAIQGLNHKTAASIQELKTENADLKAQVSQLEHSLASLQKQEQQLAAERRSAN